jgi:hypothetical protein
VSLHYFPSQVHNLASDFSLSSFFLLVDLIEIVFKNGFNLALRANILIILLLKTLHDLPSTLIYLVFIDRRMLRLISMVGPRG